MAVERTLYVGGDIVTMEEGPSPEAVLTESGRIVAVGCRKKLEREAGNAAIVDLQGGTLLPGFIDPHSHITAFAQTLGLVSLSGADSFEEIARRIRAFRESRKMKPGDWINGFGYDHNLLREGRHPDKALLDAAAPDNPVLIAHASGHMGVASSAALQAMGITADSPDPSGGRIGRTVDDEEPNGYLEEAAFLHSAEAVPQPLQEQLCAQLDMAQDIYLQHGITTVQDGLTRQKEWVLLKEMADKGRLKLDTVCYVDEALCPELVSRDAPVFSRYRNRLKIGGYKLILDGSPQGRTAWMSTPYCGGEEGYCGYPAYRLEEVEAYLRRAVEEKKQILVHCNGDAAAQQLLDAYEAVLNGRPSVIRPVMIHAQTVRADQLARMARLDMIASFFVAHTYYWGDVHLMNFGGERARRISPAHTALREGVVFTFHQDTPVLPPDMLDTVWCAVNRLSRNGVSMGKEERMSVYNALKAVTVNAAYQYFGEDAKGSIRPGKAADFVVLSRNPLACPPDALRTIKVMRTIKAGQTLYTAS